MKKVTIKTQNKEKENKKQNAVFIEKKFVL